MQSSWQDMQVAFLMGRHPRLGEESNVRLLPKELVRLILDLVAKESFIVFGGLVNRTGLSKPVREALKFQPFFDDPVSTRLCLWLDMKGCAALPDMPTALSSGFGAFDRERMRLIVGGGSERVATERQLTGADGPWEGRPNLDVFILCLKTKSWSKISSLLQKPCIGGACIIFGKKLIVLGGYHGNGFATPDRAFDVSGDGVPLRIHFPQRFKNGNPITGTPKVAAL